MANIFDLFKQISTGNDVRSLPVEYIIVGLGNPGDKYEITRHNGGFLAIDYIAEKKGVRIDRARFKALTAVADINGKGVLLMKPQTFMNLSGEAVGEAARFYKLNADKIIVISDDISLSVGRMRVRRKGSAGGHNGLKNINQHLGTDAYPRLKVGVGEKPHPEYDLVDWVLSSFNAEELKTLKASFPALLQGIEKMVAGDVDGAMQICNGK